MTKRTHTPLYVVSAMIGGSCLFADTASNVQYVYNQTETMLDSTILAVVTVAAGTAFALTAAFEAGRQRSYGVWLFLILAFCLGATFSLTATADRTNNQRLAALTKVWTADPQHQSLYQDWRKRRARADDECAPKRGGRGKLCESEELRAVEARTELEHRRMELDVTAQAIHAYMPFVPVDIASKLAPMSLPVALFLLANALLAFGLGGKKVEPEFVIQLTGRAADEDKAKRYVKQYKDQYGKAPNVIELRRAVGVSEGVARKAIRARGRRRAA